MFRVEWTGYPAGLTYAQAWVFDFLMGVGLAGWVLGAAVWALNRA